MLAKRLTRMRQASNRRYVLCSWSLVLAVCGVLAGSCPSSACDTALLVIDVQKLWLEEGDWRTIDGIYLVDAVAEVLRLGREVSLPIVYIQDTSVDATYAGADRLAFADSIAPLPGDPVFEKKDRNAFTNEALQPFLEAREIERLVVCGMASDSCVAATLMGALDLGFGVVVLEDAHSSGHGGRKAAFMNDIWSGWGIPLASALDLASYCLASDEES